jgi:peptidoglycan/LPS O-acetylase OafA/YrhL
MPRAARMVLGPLLVLLLCAASLFVFNVSSHWDAFGPYFFGAYGLGALVHWLSLSRWPRLWLLGLLMLVVLALSVAFRERLVLAALCATVLALWQWQGHALQQGWRARCADVVAHLGTHSYALFLVHFPVLMLLNAWFDHQAAQPRTLTVVLAFMAWALSNVAALPFHRWVEVPSARWRPSWRSLAPQGFLSR